MSPFSMEDVTLPSKTSRAKVKLDRLNFREPGDKSAEDRKKHLEVEIAILGKREKELESRLDEMRTKYVSRTELEEAERSFLHLSMKTNEMNLKTQELCEQLGKQVDETKRAFLQALAPRSTVDLASKIASDRLKAKQEELKERHRNRSLASWKIRNIDSELESLINTMRILRKYQEGLSQSSNAHLSEKGDISDQGSHFKVEDSAVASSDEIQEPAHTLEQETETKAVDVISESIILDAIVDEGETTGENKTNEDHNVEGERPNEAVKITNEPSTMKSLEGNTIKPTQQQEDQASEDGEMETRNDKSTTSTDIVHSGEEDEAPGSDHEMHEGPKKGLNRADADAKSVADNAIQTAPGPFFEVYGGTNDGYGSDQKFLELYQKNGLTGVEEGIEILKDKIYKMRAERDKWTKDHGDLGQKVTELQKEIDNIGQNQKDEESAQDEMDSRWRARKREYQERAAYDLRRQEKQELDLKNVLDEIARNDGSLDTDGVRKNIEDNHRQRLQDVIDGVRALESRIREVRGISDDIDNRVDWRIVLERELNLETLWLNSRAKRTTASVSMEDSSGAGAKNHLSSFLPSDFDIYKNHLSPGQVRLLVLWPAKGNQYPLLCSLKTSTWGQGASNPPYAALSYFWGPDTCNGRLYLVSPDEDTVVERADQITSGPTALYACCIPIRNNLFRALLRLRRKDLPIALWVDVICINQGDSGEKTKQLEQMINIYRNAENVCIWLGESDDDKPARSDQAMDFIESIMDFAVLDRYAHDNKQATKWYSLAELMRDRWFSRRWVVQEIALAREATVHCGDRTVQWADFADAVSLLGSNQGTIKNLFDYSEWRDGPNTLGDVQSFGAYILLEATNQLFLRTAEGQITRPFKRLESLVTSLRTFDVTDPKDLIYSLVSIASDTPQGQNIYSGKSVAAHLKVNYERVQVQVYNDFTKFCIMSSKSLDILCRPWALPITDGDPGDELPSWIPMLSTSEFGNPEDIYSGRKNGENLVGPVNKLHYKASADERYDVSLINKEKGYSRFLPVEGFKLAKIEKISSRATGGVILRDSLKMGGWTGTNEDTYSVPDKIWRTLVADKDPDGQIPPMWYQRACLRCLEIADTFNNGDLNIGELLIGNSELLRGYLTRVRNVTWNRCFFNASMKAEAHTTGVRRSPNGAPRGHVEDGQGRFTNGPMNSHGRTNEDADSRILFGLGPPNMKVGDYVCILIGCSVPVVLRENGKYMKLIGESYVHGKMGGEAMEDLRAGNTCGPKCKFELM
ncbi:heterokaryon incompatibility protein-domain-containing protein [Nemania sp. FL0031]|nr:heterokaryon incompatibility protein-domain-containing protein [Nemania sp. FL0031]